MIIKSVNITNWCQHKRLEIPNISEVSVSICGDNNIGKTSLLRGICWAMDTGNSEFGGKNDISDGETYCRVDLQVQFGKETHRFSKWIENSSATAETGFSIDDNLVTATQYKRFFVEHLGTEDYLNLFIARQEDIHATIREPKTSRNRKLRETLGIHRPEQWGSEVKNLWKEASKNQAREEGIAAEKVNNFENEGARLRQEILGKKTTKETLTDSQVIKARIGLIQSAQAFVGEHHRIAAEKNQTATKLSTAEQQLFAVEKELQEIPGTNLLEAVEAEREARLLHQQAILGNSLIQAENKQSLVPEASEQELTRLQASIHAGLQEREKLENRIGYSTGDKNEQAKILAGKTQEEVQTQIQAWRMFFHAFPEFQAEFGKSGSDILKSHLALKGEETKKLAEAENTRIKAISPKEALELLNDFWEFFREIPEPERKNPITGEQFLIGATEETIELRRRELLTQIQTDTGVGSRTVYNQLLTKAERFQNALQFVPQIPVGLEPLIETEKLFDLLKKAEATVEADQRALREYEETWARENPGNTLSKENYDSVTEKIQKHVSAREAQKQVDAQADPVKKAYPQIPWELIQMAAKNKAKDLEELSEASQKAEADVKTAQEHETKRKPKLEEKTRLEQQIQTLKGSLKTQEETLSQMKSKEFRQAEFAILALPEDPENETLLQTQKKDLENQLEQIQSLESELRLLEDTLKENEKATEKAKEEKNRIFEKGNQLVDLEQIQSFLSGKKAPELLMRSALGIILEDTNSMLPKAGLDAELRMDSSGDFEIIYDRNGKTVVEPARRQGVGYATILGMCFKLASNRIVAPGLGSVAFDEPSAAMSPRRRPLLGEFLKNLTEAGETRQVLVVEHDPAVAGSCQQTIHLSESGATIANRE